MAKKDKIGIFRLVRFYGVSSLLAIICTAIFILFFYRQLAVSVFVSISEQSNAALTQATVSSLRNHIVTFLVQSDSGTKEKFEAIPLPKDLASGIRNLMTDTDVVRVKIYDRRGTVVFSTKSSQIGSNNKDNPRFISAINGQTSTKLIYRDQLNIWDKPSDEDNLIQSYVPIRFQHWASALGVFEIYTDVNSRVREIERNEFTMTAVILLLMGSLYGALLFVVKRSEQIIKKQYQTEKDQQRTLELLTAKMLSSQEDERKHIAHELHEDIVQTLTAVKLNILTNLNDDDRRVSHLVSQKEFVSNLQNAINRTRALVMELQPPSLNDFGLTVAVTSVLRECSEVSNKINIQSNIDIVEDELNQDRKSIIFRIIKETLSSICLNKDLAGKVILNLKKENTGIILNMEIVEGFSTIEYSNAGNVVQFPEFEKMRERTILSGGNFSEEEDSSGSITYQARWN